MKKYALLALCCCGICACSEQRPAAIERPAFDVRNSSTLEIAKIEMSDSATILHVDAFFTPGYWIRISGETYIRESGGSEKLLLAKAEGIEPDKEFYMPDSGKTSFKLFFPPLPPGVVAVDFIESDCPDCFKIWGLRLRRGDKIAIAPIPKTALSGKSFRPLPPPSFGQGTAKLSGKYLGYVEGCFEKEVTVQVAGTLSSGSGSQIKLPVAADGSFSGEIPIDRPQLVSFSGGVVFLAPGDSQEIYIDLKRSNRSKARYRTDKEPDDSLYVYSPSPESYLSAADLRAIGKLGNTFDFSSMCLNIADMTRDEFKEYLLGELRHKLAALKQAGYSDNASTLLEQNMKIDAVGWILNADKLLDHAYRSAHKKTRSSATQAEAPDVAYYSFLKELLDDKLSYSPKYLSLLSELSSAAAFARPEGETLAEKLAYFNEKISPLLGSGCGLLLDMLQAQLLANRLQALAFYTDADKQLVRETFAGKPAIADALIAENDKMQALISSAKESKTSVIREAPAVGRDKMLNAILSEYRGKVVLVDFWATWCGPCLRANEQIKPLKAEWAGKDIVFLYLTGETSPLTSWYKMTPNIHGEHYRVSDSQFEYWYKTLEIQGVPTYFIYDRKGNQTYRATGFPGAGKIKEEVEKHL